MIAAIVITTTVIIKAMPSVYSMNEVIFKAYYRQGIEETKEKYEMSSNVLQHKEHT